MMLVYFYILLAIRVCTSKEVVDKSVIRGVLSGIAFPKWNRGILNSSPAQKSEGRFWPTAQKESRFLSLFTVITFPNGGCAGASGDNGTCLTARECSAKGGSVNGYCANGYGLCCVFMKSCGATTSENGTYFVNSGYPSAYDGTGSCELTVIKSDPDVCQIRLDFIRFTTAGPDQTNHVCNQDQFIVSGGNPVPAICGVNQGSHMYIDAGVGTTNPVKLTFVTSGSSFERLWKVKVTQIPCSTIYKADEGCLQYYVGVSGQLRSFNYDPASGLQLSNQDYGICVRMERNFCGIQYTACPDTVNNRSRSFTLSGNSNGPVNSMIGSGAGPNNCANDWLLVPCAANVGRIQPAQALCTDRICGGTFSADLSMQSATVLNNDDTGSESKTCGKILVVLSWILVVLTMPFSLFICFKVVQEYERAVIFRLGRLLSGGAKGPGIFFILPCIDTYARVDLRTRTYDIPPQEVLTKDSVTVSVDAVVYYRVHNATISIANVENAHQSTRLLAQTTLRNTMGTRPLHEILSERETISGSMQLALDEATEAWGIKVERVEIKDVRLPIQLQRAMAAEAEAAREARAKVIAAEGEQKASRALREASEVIGDSPAALQLRYLQTLNTISAEKNSTIVFPLPIDLLTYFIKAREEV